MGILRALVERFGKRGAAEIVEQAERIRPPVREIGAGGMPIAQAQPYRNSLRGGSDDLMEAARSRTPESAWEEFGSLQGGTPEARGGGAGGGNASVGQSLRGFHGSPRSGLTSVSANPEARQFDNATSQFGAFVSPTRQGAQRYGENVYDVSVDLRRPYEMDLAEFNRFQAPNRGANGEALPGEMWQQRMAELKQEATALRERLAQEGYDGVIVRNRNGEPTEIASFSDIPLGNPPQPLLGGTPEARLRAQEQGYTGPWYRGLSQPYDDAQANPAFYVNDPRYASDFATGQDGANVVPVMLRTRGARQVPYADIEGQYDGMWNGSVGDGVVVSQEPSNSGRMLAVARPGGDIRSIFAAFDPAKRDRSDLLAGLALGAPLGGGLLSHAQRRRERARA